MAAISATTPPPVAVLPNGKTNLIAHDLGADGDPIEALERVLELARTDMVPHIVSRELISLSDGSAAAGRCSACSSAAPASPTRCSTAGTRSIRSACPTGVGARARPAARPARACIVGRRRALPAAAAGADHGVGDSSSGELQGRFAFLMVTTLQRLLFSGNMPGGGRAAGAMQLLVIERSLLAMLARLRRGSIRGRLGRSRLRGVHLERGDEIRIEGGRSSVHPRRRAVRGRARPADRADGRPRRCRSCGWRPEPIAYESRPTSIRIEHD